MAPKQQPRHIRWLEDYGKASAWMERFDIKRLLKKGGGLAKISNFLPDFVAEGILSDLERLPDSAWNATEASSDYSQNNISHSFQSIRQAKGLDRAVRLLSLLLPDELNSFSAARYTSGDHIAPHDDRAYTKVRLEDGSIISTSRSIAVIVYLTQDWTSAQGGLLVDLEDPQGSRTYVPEFNSAIVFTIPRWHQVTPMATDRPRYTLFGWFLTPGRLYDLNLGGEQPPAPRLTSSKTPAGKERNASKAASQQVAISSPAGAGAGGDQPQEQDSASQGTVEGVGQLNGVVRKKTRRGKWRGRSAKKAPAAPAAAVLVPGAQAADPVSPGGALVRRQDQVKRRIHQEPSAQGAGSTVAPIQGGKVKVRAVPAGAGRVQAARRPAPQAEVSMVSQQPPHKKHKKAVP